MQWFPRWWRTIPSHCSPGRTSKEEKGERGTQRRSFPVRSDLIKTGLNIVSSCMFYFSTVTKQQQLMQMAQRLFFVWTGQYFFKEIHFTIELRFLFRVDFANEDSLIRSILTEWIRLWTFCQPAEITRTWQWLCMVTTPLGQGSTSKGDKRETPQTWVQWYPFFAASDWNMLLGG